tara:strand:+ start:242 stop:442 length:201 start_codon:yes stop_codon:yes gene_type:complete
MSFGEGLAIILICVLFVLGSCFLYVDYKYFSTDNVIKTKQPMIPTLDVRIIDGVVDTTYIYNQPKG